MNLETTAIAGSRILALGLSLLLAFASVSGAEPIEPDGLSGPILWTRDVTGYTYVQIDMEHGEIWAAVPRTSVRVGDVVHLVGAEPIANFYSPTLDRRFDRIYFAERLRVDRPDSAASIAGVRTVGEILTAPKDLIGMQVTVRGEIVKFTRAVMGRNWLHLKDGSVAPDGSDDLAITTQASVALGSTVSMRGILQIDRDFGFGYRYGVLIEDAIIVEE
ncbi:MAG: hypothetical protein JRH01_19950 [Deltaproteobacteria bacterium]|nr:hypothetical protein [Deltaproteobacteria bacterium]MBW2396248.1 hypothetical protein [Deltaproteobacteria bacterium]